MQRTFQLLALCAALLGLSGGVAKAADVRTPLLCDAVINGRSIYLSDLLPQSSPSALRIPAQEIRIGTAPQPGSTRILSSNEIVRLLTDGNLRSRVDVPEQIVVHRFGHVVTREEVVAAIQKALSRNEPFQGVHLTPEDLRFNARVLVSAEDADLRVTRIEMDQTLHNMKFWLASGAEPALLPFLAVAPVTCDACASAETVQPMASANAPRFFPVMKTSTTIPSAPPILNGNRPIAGAVLVEAGKKAQLHLVSGAEMQMYLTAISLDHGMLGQTIRVRIQNTGKILSVHVVGRNQVEANL